MRRTVKQISKDPFIVVGIIIVGMVLAMASVVPLIISGDPNHIAYVSEPQPPSLTHPFGTDDLGRDTMLRIIFGARISLIVAFVSVLISLSIGTLIGSIAGFYGGVVDEIIMRVIDGLMAIPTIFLLLTIQVLLTPSIYNVIIIIGVTSWMGVARIVRAEVLALAARDFVKAARSFGFGNSTIIFKCILPNALGPLFVTAVLSMGGAILTESALSYFGLGVQPPQPSWGNMLYNAQDYLLDAWWMTFFPGVFILLTVLALNFIGDGMYRIFNPKN
ncbi:MAG: peptide ABC transporter permease [Candidatus Margulisbacteria bacterium GWF2_38_17]|nr:MAG: peptide ABC transporter permease [Candidatus Margulisbacteria bacterium GWF2_38_17]